MVDYWLAGYFGRVWLGLRKGLRPLLGEVTGLCPAVARGEPLPAGQLWRVQDFAVRVWWRFGMASVLVMFAIGMIAIVTAHGTALNVAVGIVVTLLCFMAVAGGQVFMLRYRSDRTSWPWRAGRCSCSGTGLTGRGCTCARLARERGSCRCPRTRLACRGDLTSG